MGPGLSQSLKAWPKTALFPFPPRPPLHAPFRLGNSLTTARGTQVIGRRVGSIPTPTTRDAM